jgi:hypothetical protein
MRVIHTVQLVCATLAVGASFVPTEAKADICVRWYEGMCEEWEATPSIPPILVTGTPQAPYYPIVWATPVAPSDTGYWSGYSPVGSWCPPNPRIKLLPAGANTRTTGECKNENDFQQRVRNSLENNQPPGTPFMDGPFAYPSGANWQKYTTSQYTTVIASPLNPTVISYFLVTVHYERNSVTGDYTLPHFKNTPYEGCGNV